MLAYDSAPSIEQEIRHLIRVGTSKFARRRTQLRERQRCQKEAAEVRLEIERLALQQEIMDANATVDNLRNIMGNTVATATLRETVRVEERAGAERLRETQQMCETRSAAILASHAAERDATTAARDAERTFRADTMRALHDADRNAARDYQDGQDIADMIFGMAAGLSPPPYGAGRAGEGGAIVKPMVEAATNDAKATAETNDRVDAMVAENAAQRLQEMADARRLKQVHGLLDGVARDRRHEAVGRVMGPPTPPQGAPPAFIRPTVVAPAGTVPDPRAGTELAGDMSCIEEMPLPSPASADLPAPPQPPPRSVDAMLADEASPSPSRLPPARRLRGTPTLRPTVRVGLEMPQKEVLDEMPLRLIPMSSAPAPDPAEESLGDLTASDSDESLVSTFSPYLTPGQRGARDQ